jgi:class 3 adenylate cyclase
MVELPGSDCYPFYTPESEDVLHEIGRFLTGESEELPSQRELATVLFTDVVGSTDLAARLGDDRWLGLRQAHDEIVRRNLAAFRGREIATTGDGFLATFDGPARAIRAAHAIRAELAEHGLQVRVGLHAGEVELLGEDIGGIAVHVAARVMAQAQAGEVLCSRTVKDLVAGAGFIFADRGTRRLKDVADRWQLYAVQPADR